MMSSYPFYVPLLLLLLLTLLWVWWGRRKSARALRSTGHLRVGAVAERLGLTLVRGDPDAYLERGKSEGDPPGQEGRNRRTTVEAGLLAKGHPYGRTVELRCMAVEGADLQPPAAGPSLAHTPGCCWLSVTVLGRLPKFELVLPDPSEPAELQRVYDELPTVPLVDPSGQESVLALFAEDPQLAARIAPALGRFRGLGRVHVIGEPGRVHSRFGWGTVHGLVDRAEAHLYALVCVACALEERPLPNPVTVADVRSHSICTVRVLP